MSDSPRLCAHCNAWGDHHTDRHPGGLIGSVVELPDGVQAKVIDVEHDYDDGTTLRYLTGPNAGSLTMRDTFAVRRLPRQRRRLARLRCLLAGHRLGPYANTERACIDCGSLLAPAPPGPPPRPTPGIENVARRPR